MSTDVICNTGAPCVVHGLGREGPFPNTSGLEFLIFPDSTGNLAGQSTKVPVFEAQRVRNPGMLPRRTDRP